MLRESMERTKYVIDHRPPTKVSSENRGLGNPTSQRRQIISNQGCLIEAQLNRLGNLEAKGEEPTQELSQR